MPSTRCPTRTCHGRTACCSSSPEIGISPLARIANSHKLLSFLPYFATFKWQSIEPEYDPFKYNSFPKNAGQQAHDLTATLQRQVKKLHQAGGLAAFPPVLAFLSRSDATVKTSATVQRLFDQLASFLPAAIDEPLKRLEARSDLPYRLTVITNVAQDSERVAQHSKAPRLSTTDSTPLSLAWPRGVYSLSHVAIPFAPDDPVYGAGQGSNSTYQGLPLGMLQPRGETHLLSIPLSQLLRLRHNPFFAYLARRVEAEIDATLQRD